ncbi:MAG: TIGR02757 family protein [Myxococcales bacterium]|nr:TIGR02757 family protein [Myxococcales bacterium]
MTLSRARAARLKPLLDAVADDRPWIDRMRFDPVEFPHRYTDPRDIEIVALLSASLAYGRADLFKPKIESVLSKLGKRPATRLKSLEVGELNSVLDGFVYRFNLPADVGVLLMGMGACLREHGSLEATFLEARRTSGDNRAALSTFARTIRDAAPRAEIVRVLGKTRGLDHLLPVGNGAAKRLSLYLRWMVRGPDAIDFGIWTRVKPAELVIPLDTHIARLSTWLGLTSRQTQGWAMAEEITESLRHLEPDDPVRYDFSLCHFGMSGACPVHPVKENCRKCPLRGECRIGRRAG